MGVFMKELTPYLECAMAVNTHGVRGCVRLENRCDSPAVLAKLKTMYIKKNGEFTPLKVLKSSVQKNMVLTTFDGIETLEDAIALKGTVLYAARSDFRLRPGDYFIADLIGLPVYDESGEKVGTLKNVTSPGAHQVYVIEDGDGEFMLPNVPEFVLRISLEEEDEGIYVHLIEGMRENSR